MLSSFKLGSDVKVEARTDSAGGSYILDSGLYPMTVDMIYLDKSANGAHCMNFRFTGATDPAIKYKETIYFSNRAGEVTYNDKKDGSKRPLPGFTKVNEILLAICGKEMSELEAQTATIKVYDKAAGGEVNAQREVLVDLLKQNVNLGIIRKTENKQVKNPGAGKPYINDPTGALRDINEIHTAFRFEDNMSVAEMERGAEEAKFHTKWVDNFEGKTIDKSEKVQGAAVAGVPSAPASAPLVFD